MRRWARLKLIADCFVEFNGKPVASVKKGFKSALGLARLTGKVTPHTFAPHGGDLAHAARRAGVGGCRLFGHVGRGAAETYGHHHPDFLHGAANAITSKHRVSVVESVVELDRGRQRRQKA